MTLPSAIPPDRYSVLLMSGKVVANPQLERARPETEEGCTPDGCYNTEPQAIVIRAPAPPGRLEIYDYVGMPLAEMKIDRRTVPNLGLRRDPLAISRKRAIVKLSRNTLPNKLAVYYRYARETSTACLPGNLESDQSSQLSMCSSIMSTPPKPASLDWRRLPASPACDSSYCSSEADCPSFADDSQCSLSSSHSTCSPTSEVSE